MKEIDKNTNEKKYNLCSWTWRFNIVTIFIWFKVIYRFNAISIITSMLFFIERKKTLKFICSHEMDQIILPKQSWGKSEGGIISPDFKTYHKTIVSK
jgi:hypothetical protein